MMRIRARLLAMIVYFVKTCTEEEHMDCHLRVNLLDILTITRIMRLTTLLRMQARRHAATLQTALYSERQQFKNIVKIYLNYKYT